jgi:molecular chaperone DnaJ
MNTLINYYAALRIKNTAEPKEIKKAYYNLSKELHPDRGGDKDDFAVIAEAYAILSDIDTKKEYDKKSRYGLNYDESVELYNFEFNNLAKTFSKNKYEEFKNKELLNIVVYIDDTFNGTVEYERMVTCKDCNGTGKDLKSKLVIKDPNGNIRYLDATDGCDACEGSGKIGDKICYFCSGAGKSYAKFCDTCGGHKRILGKQKINNINTEGKDKYKVPFMGNTSRDANGKVGDLWLIKKSEE